MVLVGCGRTRINWRVSGYGILGWIGWTMATTPPPKPIEEIAKELEAETKAAETQQAQQPQQESGKKEQTQ